MPVEYKIDPKHIKSAPISGPPTGKRVSLEKQIVTVISPEGEIVECTRNVANDRVRILGWKWAFPKDDKDENAEASTPADPEAYEEQVSVEAAVEAEAQAPSETELALAYLESLRDEAEKLGVKVDQRWGKKRLQKEIEAAQSGVDAE